MRRRLFFYTMLLLLVGLLAFFGISVYITHTNNISIAKDDVTETARNYTGIYRSVADVAALAETTNDTRITIISSDGMVLADSRPLDVDALENHLERPEIQAALNGAPAVFIRHSESLGVDMVYYALKVDHGESYVFLRAAIPVKKIDAYLFQSLPLLVLLVLAIALICFFFARGMVNRVTKPFGYIEQRLQALSGGEYIPAPAAQSFEEINRITQGIDEVSRIVQAGISKLRDEKGKLDYILENMSDGLIVLDENKSVTLINSAALATFGVSPDVIGKDFIYLTYDKSLGGAVDGCANRAENAFFELPLDGRIFFVTVKRLPETALTTVILSDVTETRENAKLREQFFANASHELKTPLTAIKGFSELVELNNKDESIDKYVRGIRRETDRMLMLIADMLKLSELENAEEINPEPVSLAKAAIEVHEALSASIIEKNIAFEMVGDATVKAEPAHVYELLKNLMENAVRYNDPGGRVNVAIEFGRKGASLLISDNGIGIAPEEQARIFERYYRVERSRSQQKGGTGLGLSIVKHICALYGWQLTLKSRLGVGTEITVEF